MALTIFHKQYVAGWSHVDFRRFNHFKADDGGDVVDVSFLCPNAAHTDLLIKTLGKWGANSKGIHVSRGHNFGGYVIVMVSLKDAALPALTKALEVPFEQALKEGGVAFLRGYIDHQVVSGLAISKGPSTRHTRWSYDKIRISFSSDEHIDPVRRFCVQSGVTESMWVADTSTNAHAMLLLADPALKLLSWLSIVKTDQGPPCPFFARIIIPRLVAHVRRLAEQETHMAVPPPVSSAGFIVHLPIKAAEYLQGPISSPEVGKLLVLEFDSEINSPKDKCMSLQSHASPKTCAGAAFLDLCVPTCMNRNYAGEVRLRYMGGPLAHTGTSSPFEDAFGIINLDTLSEHVEIEISMQRHEWLVMCENIE